MKPTKNSLIPYYKEINLRGKEYYRIYKFPGDEEVMIQKPQSLIVSDNGHRIVDDQGVSHYVPYGWIHLYWKNIGDRAFYCQESEEEQQRMACKVEIEELEDLIDLDDDKRQ